jgi:polysaccharide pyruvyl transferase CsaB
MKKIKNIIQSITYLYPFCKPRYLFKKSNKIFIYGVYGVGNLGDEIILKSILLQLKYIKNYQIIVISKKPLKIFKEYNTVSINPYFLKYFATLFNKFSSSMILLVGGGGILKDYNNSPKALRNFISIINLCIKSNFKTMLYSAGVENIVYDESKSNLKEILNKFNIITVRDNNSKNLLKSFGIEKKIFVTGDPAILEFYSNKHKNISCNTNPLIIVSLRHWFEKGYYVSNKNVFNDFLLVLTESLNKAIEFYNANIVFIPFRTVYFDNDLEIINKVAININNKSNITILKSVPSLETLKYFYSIADLTIGMRLHSIILSFSSSVPMIALSYSSKVSDFMNYIGLHEFSYFLSEINTDVLINRIDFILSNSKFLKSKLDSKKRSYIKMLNINISLLKKLL